MAELPNSIQVTALSKSFAEVRAIEDLSFQVEPGEIFGLVGPDGAGKTTTLRVLAGVLKADRGSVIVGGHDVASDPRMLKRDISYMPQRFGLYEDLTVDENIRFCADLFGVPRKLRQDRAARLLAACDMSEFRGRLAGRLSGGMKQKLGLVCALIHAPRVLLLDEPTTGVDPVSRREFWNMLYVLVSEGVAVLSSTAYLDEAERCHRVALLYRGRMLMCDSPKGLRDAVKGSVVSILSNQARQMQELLAGDARFAQSVLVGNALHVFVDDAMVRIPQLESSLRAGGVGYEEIAQVAPTIEDLFVHAVTAEAGHRH
jgi:ABC-2 type transport system ATP-binding protein